MASCFSITSPSRKKSYFFHFPRHSDSNFILDKKIEKGNETKNHPLTAVPNRIFYRNSGTVPGPYSSRDPDAS